MGSRATAAVVIVAFAAGVGAGIGMSRHDSKHSRAALVVSHPLSKCGRAVLVDFSDNARVDRLYPLHCYQEALAATPGGMVGSTAPKGIQRALFYARSRQADPTPVTVARIQAGETVVLGASRARPGDWITCVKGDNRVRVRVPSLGRGVGLSADGLTYSATLDVTASKVGRVVASCR
jgi:hypothetical protein